MRLIMISPSALVSAAALFEQIGISGRVGSLDMLKVQRRLV